MFFWCKSVLCTFWGYAPNPLIFCPPLGGIGFDFVKSVRNFNFAKISGGPYFVALQQNTNLLWLMPQIIIFLLLQKYFSIQTAKFQIP